MLPIWHSSSSSTLTSIGPLTLQVGSHTTTPSHSTASTSSTMVDSSSSDLVVSSTKNSRRPISAMMTLMRRDLSKKLSSSPAVTWQCPTSRPSTDPSRSCRTCRVQPPTQPLSASGSPTNQVSSSPARAAPTSSRAASGSKVSFSKKSS